MQIGSKQCSALFSTLRRKQVLLDPTHLNQRTTARRYPSRQEGRNSLGRAQLSATSWATVGSHRGNHCWDQHSHMGTLNEVLAMGPQFLLSTSREEPVKPTAKHCAKKCGWPQTLCALAPAVLKSCSPATPKILPLFYNHPTSSHAFLAPCLPTFPEQRPECALEETTRHC